MKLGLGKAFIESYRLNFSNRELQGVLCFSNFAQGPHELYAKETSKPENSSSTIETIFLLEFWFGFDTRGHCAKLGEHNARCGPQ